LMYRGAESKKNDTCSADALRKMPRKYLSGLFDMTNANVATLP
jgi:hypothetical protein